jgi:predicted acylesterase/phospholipase RssA
VSAAAAPTAADLPRPARRALVLCGGGATGAAYEIGVLAALEASIPGFRIQHFDVFVGTSAGALIAAQMAAGVSAARLFFALTNDDDYFRPRRADVYAIDPRDALQKLLAFSAAVGRSLTQLRRRGEGEAASLDLGDLARTLPDGLFTLAGYQRFVERFFTRNGLPLSFEAVTRQLLIPANNLDTAHREVFGRGYRLDASIPEAIAASSAIPLFFAPVRIGHTDLIDGGTGKVAHVDLAVAAGATHALIVNPIVPWNLTRRLHADRKRGRLPPGTLTRIRDRGMWGIWNQAFRISTVTRLQLGLRRFAALNPNLAMALITPREEDETLFVTNPMSTDARATVARHAFAQTRARLAQGDDAVRAVCLGEPDAHLRGGLRQPGDDEEDTWRGP